MAKRVVIPVDTTDSTVTRLIAKSVMEQLLFDTEIFDIKEAIYIQRGQIAAQSQVYNDDETLLLEVNNLVTVEYKEAPIQEHFDINKYQTEYPKIFQASNLGVSMTPMHARVQMEINFTYKSKSYGALTTWLNAFKRRLLNAEPTFFHDVVYNYTIPTDATAYIQQVYTLQENVAPYGITLTDFINQHFAVNGLVVRHNLNDSNQVIAMNVKNSGCLGVFTQLPEERETYHEPPMSSVTFTYVVTYDRVTAILLEYQKYIHNQLIDLEFINRYCDRRLHTNAHDGNLTVSQSVNQVTSNLYNLPAMAPYDETDGWRPNNPLQYVKSSTIVPVQLDLTNLTDVLDLNLLSEFNYPPWLITLMQTYATKLCTAYLWPIYIELFEVNANCYLVPIQVNTNLQLTSNISLDPRCRHYIRLSVVTNLFQVDFSTLQRQPATLLQLLQWINPKVTLQTLGNGSFVTDASLLAALNLINCSNYKHKGSPVVMGMNIMARITTDIDHWKKLSGQKNINYEI